MLIGALRLGKEGGCSLLGLLRPTNGRRHIPREGGVDIVSRLDKRGDITFYEIVATAADVTTGETGDGKNLTVVVESVARRYEAAALESGLDNERGIGETSDDAVSRDEIVGFGLRAERELGKDGTLPRHLGGNLAMLRRVDGVKPMGDDTDGVSSGMESGTMGSHVDAESETRDDDDVGVALADVGDDGLAEGPPLIGRATRAYDAEQLGSLEIDVSLDEERHRGIGTSRKPMGIVGIGEGQEAHLVALGFLDLGIGETESVIATCGYGVGKISERRSSVGEISGFGIEDISCRAEVGKELSDYRGTDPGNGGKSQNISEICCH